MIPTKDRSDVLGRAIGSALTQEGPTVEVIVVDDGSGAEAAVAVRAASEIDPRITHLRNESAIGPSAARNRGLEAASARLVCFLDDDNELLPGRLAAQAPLVDADDVIAVAGVELVPPGGGPSERMDPGLPSPTRVDGTENPFTMLPSRLFVHTYLAPAELVRSVGAYDASVWWGEHTELFLRLRTAARFVGAPVLGTRVHRAEASPRASRDFERKVEGIRRIMARHPEVFERAPALRAEWLDVLGVALLRIGRRDEAREALRASLTARMRLQSLRHLVAAATRTERVLCRT